MKCLALEGRTMPTRSSGAGRRRAKRKSAPKVTVFGINHVAMEVTDLKKAVAFYADVFNLEKNDEGEGDAFFQIGEHQFLALFEVRAMKPDRVRHFGLIVRDERQIARVREVVTKKYGLKLNPG